MNRLPPPGDLVDQSFLAVQAAAIRLRDEVISLNLKAMGVSTLLDVGCDFGSLLELANQKGIKARGIDVNLDSIRKAREAGLNTTNLSMEDLFPTKISDFVTLTQSGHTALSCLNILHGEWKDKTIRDKFISNSLNYFDYVVITSTRKQLKKIQREHDITFFKFIGPRNGPITKFQYTLSQYGTTFFFTGRLHKIEKSFWQIFTGGYSYANPVNTYLDLVIIMSSKRAT